MRGDFSRRTYDQVMQQLAAQTQYDAVLQQQGRVPLDADWNEQQALHQRRIETETLDVIGACGAPFANPGFALKPSVSGTSLLIGAGRFYVDGILCENTQDDLDYTHQPNLPNPPTVKNTPDVAGILTGANKKLGIVYLDVWQRHITALNDPLIREVALGGPDTATRVQIIWQVKVLPVNLPKGGFACETDFPEWDTLVAVPSPGTLTAQTQPPGPNDDPCLLPPSAGYQRLENQLYRVEVHQTSPLLTFKWSRDNGSVVTAIESGGGQTLVVHDVGPDDALGFANGQWVEVVDDRTEMNGLPGQLVQIDTVTPATRTITLRSPLAAPIDVSRHPRLHRWDQSGSTASATGVRVTGGAQDLEGGIQVTFSSSGTFTAGDYWLIPARTATGEIEWPPYQVSNTTPAAIPPLQIRHHFCRLGLVQLNGQNKLNVQDCRPIFPPLSSPAIHVVGTSWKNDDVYSVQDFVNGLLVTFDGPPDAQYLTELTEAVMIVTVEVPFGGSTAEPFDVGVIAEGIISIVPGSAYAILWKPPQELVTALAKLLGQTQGFSATSLMTHGTQRRPIRVRVTLKGHTIWSTEGTQRHYLDGQAFGQPGTRANRSARVALIFPSGNGARASNFESWFYLGMSTEPRPAPVRLTSVTLNPSTVQVVVDVHGTVRGTSQGTVFLSGPAPADVRITLASDNSGVAQVLQPVVVPATQASANFEVRILTLLKPREVATITATLGSDSPTAFLTVVAPPLKVGHVRIQSTLSHMTPDNLVLIGSALQLERLLSFHKDLPNRIDVEFVGALVDLHTVVNRQSFVVTHTPNGGQAANLNGYISTAGNVSSWTIEGLDAMPPGHYKVLLVGEGQAVRIVSTQQRALDGEPRQLPSGNNGNGSNFEFEFDISPE